MDLLLKNPRYFFDTYFSVPAWELLIIWLAIFGVGMFVSRRRYGNKAPQYLFWNVAFSLFLTVTVAISLLNTNRIGIRNLILNPHEELRAAFRGDPHSLRHLLSNVLLYVPLGFMWRRKARTGSTVLMGLLLSFAIECLQFGLSCGTAETVDVITNTAGTFLGAAFSAGIIKLHDGITGRK